MSRTIREAAALLSELLLLCVCGVGLLCLLLGQALTDLLRGR